MSDLPPPTPPEVPLAAPAPEPIPPEVPPVPEAASPASTASGGEPLPKDANEKTLGVVMHLIPLAGFVISWLSIPVVGSVIAPLVFWLIKKNESPYLDAHGKEVLNFQINVAVLCLPIYIPFIGCIAIPVVLALSIAAFVYMVIAAMKVNEGQFYRYPWIYRIIK